MAVIKFETVITINPIVQVVIPPHLDGEILSDSVAHVCTMKRPLNSQINFRNEKKKQKVMKKQIGRMDVRTSKKG